ncbi:cysteine hydrolase family protein [Ferrovibrio xuzhouensis]|uniref:Cysteine hydrolase family protein n=1 Tax=Ferrovibrio xuzhouensis TaxID=1576914 RepID=A0ABV7VNS4_9PROT
MTGMKMMGARPEQSWLVGRDVVDMTRPAKAVRPIKLAALPQNIVVDANKSALVIVDMQNDFCATGGWMDSQGIDVTPNTAPIEPLKALVAAFRAQGLPVVWVNWGVRKDLLNISPSLLHAHNKTGDAVDLGSPVPGTRSEVLRAGSWGAQVVDGLNPGDADIHVTKHRFSGFWDTDLDAILRNLGVKTLFVGGVNLDQCVMTTLEDANFLGYDTILVEDGAATTSPDYCVQAALYNIRLLFGFTLKSETLLQGLAP